MKALTQEWRFPTLNYGVVSGISHAGIEDFKGTPFKSLAREICQNSLDASLNNQKPVTVVFETFQISPDQIPGYEELRSDFSLAAQHWNSNKKAKKFFKKANEILNGKKPVTCLRVSDYNTTGLTGIEGESGSPWQNLVKSQGTSDKSGSTGGSFGIGKFASFALSGLRTVFYSTYNHKKESAFQGVCILPSFLNKNKEETQGTGFYGNPKNTPVLSQLHLESGYSVRTGDDFGTDIYILGFLEGKSWEEEITKSVLDGFLYAIYDNKLIVKINSTVIDSSTLPQIFQKFEDFPENAQNYYRVLMGLKDGKTKEFTSDILGLGKATLYLAIEPGLHKRVAMVRKTGMKIMDRANLSGSIPFAGLMFIEGEELNQKLRELENPQHTKWEPDRAENKAEAKRLIKALRDFILESLKSLRNEESSRTIDPDTGEFLSFENIPEKDDKRIESVNNEIKDITIKTITQNRPAYQEEVITLISDNESPEGDRPTNQPEDVPGSSGRLPGKRGDQNNGDNEGTGGSHPTGSQENETGGKEEPKKLKRRRVKASVRTMVLSKNDGKYLLKITPQQNSADCTAAFYYVGDDGQKTRAELVKAFMNEQPLTVRGNEITGLKLDDGKPVSIAFYLNDDDLHSLEIDLYELFE